MLLELSPTFYFVVHPKKLDVTPQIFVQIGPIIVQKEAHFNVYVNDFSLCSLMQLLELRLKWKRGE